MYDRHYVASNITLVVCSTDPLDVLQAAVAKAFAAVRTGGSTATGCTSGGSGGKKKKNKKKQGGPDEAASASAAPASSANPAPASAATAAATSAATSAAAAAEPPRAVGAPPPPLQFQGLAGSVVLVRPVAHVNALRLVWPLGGEQLSKWRSKPSELVRAVITNTL